MRSNERQSRNNPIKCKGNEPDTSSLGLFFLFFVGPRDKDVFPLVSFPVKHFIKELDGAELVSLPLMLDLTLKPICLVFWFYKYISWALTYSIKEKQERRDLSSVQRPCSLFYFGSAVIDSSLL
tara:strand:- start:219 stop:590 length:372 start_codon:yes stop_codon:yes gene_type:complete